MYSHRQFSFRFFPSAAIFIIIFFGSISAQQEQSLIANSVIQAEEPGANGDPLKETEVQKQSALFGSLFGFRSVIAPLGVDVNGTIKSDLWRNMSGGIQQGASNLFYMDVSMAIDLNEVAGLNGSSFFVQYLGNNGKSISNSIGDFQKVSNIEAYSMYKFYQCWVQQNFYDDDLSLLIGIYDLNSEFYITPTSQLFLNSSHGIGIDLGQTGNNGPSIFPNAALSFRISYLLSTNAYVRCAVFDGIPGDVVDPEKFGVSLSAADGYLAIAEAGIIQEEGFTAGIGIWKYSGMFQDLCIEINPGSPIQRNDNYGGYILMDKLIYQNNLQASEILRGFLRFGFANGHINMFKYQFGAGVVWSGLIQARSDDEFGYAVASAHAGNDYQAFNQLVYSSSVSAETTHELTYKMRMAGWFNLQYDLQYIVHPSANPTIGNAFAGGIRMEVLL